MIRTYKTSVERENDLFADVLMSDSLFTQKKCEKLYKFLYNTV